MPGYYELKRSREAGTLKDQGCVTFISSGAAKVSPPAPSVLNTAAAEISRHAGPDHPPTASDNSPQAAPTRLRARQTKPPSHKGTQGLVSPEKK